jgi:hypothetical protein
MPIATIYKGVAIFAGQPTKRIAVVKREVDRVAAVADLVQLFEIAGDCSWSPEARIYAGARCIAGLERSTERREARPDINREDVEARTAGLSSLSWADPFRYCSLIDAHYEHAVMREQPLPDE